MHVIAKSGKQFRKNSCSNETLFSLLNISAGLKKKQQIYIINNLLKKAHVISQNAGNVINKHLKGRGRPRKMGTKTCRKLWEMRRNLWIDKWAICVFFCEESRHHHHYRYRRCLHHHHHEHKATTPSYHHSPINYSKHRFCLSLSSS